MSGESTSPRHREEPSPRRTSSPRRGASQTRKWSHNWKNFPISQSFSSYATIRAPKEATRVPQVPQIAVKEKRNVLAHVSDD
ncbi:hypothetical protein COLSTE_00307 [Collinsella stercoris DSM 13279]|uniref:Uncharacterized protein n=1 Tax=Collinsella stercoris DSM 13279 TaxID=445975 RepID=B6G8B7_9ACTN|nr:hypothetical protein COLSTE_00307 [Collinsella stercoris DSM 13279]